MRPCTPRCMRTPSEQMQDAVIAAVRRNVEGSEHMSEIGRAVPRAPTRVPMTQAELDQASRLLRPATWRVGRQQRILSFSTIGKITGIVGAQRSEFLPDTHP